MAKIPKRREAVPDPEPVEKILPVEPERSERAIPRPGKPMPPVNDPE